MTVTKILCPVDLVEEGESRVVDYATALASKLDASVHVLHVYDLPGYVHPPAFSPAAETYAEHALRDRKAKLAALLEHHGGASVEGGLKPGVPHRRIAEEVERLGIDLVVMGTHARSGPRRFLLGSIAERVLRTSKVPVLTVPYRKEGVHAPPRSVLVPHDFSECSRRALDLVRTLRKPLHLAVSVVHALPPELEGDVPHWLTHAERDRYRDVLERELQRDVADVFGPEEQIVKVRIEHGPVVERIIHQRDVLGADLIAIGASGKTGMERFLLGSVTVELLRRADIPVLTVP